MKWRENTSVCFSLVYLPLEAEMAKNRIDELKAQDFNKRREELVYNQAREREEVEQAHIMEY